MILSHAKIEEIAAAVIKDFNLFFFGEKASEARSMPQGTPIDQFASEYLRLKISFEKLSVDGSLCGLTAYEDTEYAIEENGVSRTIPLKRNQVLLDSSFIAPGDVRKLCGKRRFTLAHECAHQLLFHLESEDELEDALDTFFFRWSVCLSHNKDYFLAKKHNPKVNKLAQNGLAYLNRILKGEIPL